ncbi:MAG: hydrogenase maturation protease [Candidatus Omnitrophota bacterium]|nr:hydrogenase maturation protease [Candidatus Omnitrophota bacterium]
MTKTLIIGIGSILRGDDGIGPRTIDALENEKLAEGVELERGDLSGMDLLKFFPGYGKVIIIDAADMEEKPGTVKVFRSGELKGSGFKNISSTHGMGLLETLTLARSMDMEDGIIVVGVQPERTGFALEISDTVKESMPVILEEVKKLL